MAKLPRSKATADLLHDPIGVYKTIQARIDAQGNLAPMEEFEPAINFLKEGLRQPEVVDYCRSNAFAEGQRQLALNALWHIGLDFEVDPETGGYHQHTPPFTGRYPYLPSLQAVDQAVAFFDTYERARKIGHDDHYQLDRYRYHDLSLPYLEDWIVMPTADTLTLKDLIALRAIPVGATMVADHTSFLDAYHNSPLNAKVHDSNHNRRFRSENRGYFERNGITTREDKIKTHEQWNDTIQNVVLPSIAITKDMPAKEKNIRKAMTLLYFEWLHEYAKTPERTSLVMELTFKPDGPSAFEIVLKPGETMEELEQRRMENKNLDSGAIYARGQEGYHVCYFMDKGRNFLTSTYNKIMHGFYDNPERPMYEAPSMDARSPEIFAEAALRMMSDFGVTADEVGLSRQTIVNLLTNQAPGHILGENLETYPGHIFDHPLSRAPRLARPGEKPDTIRQGFKLEGA